MKIMLRRALVLAVIVLFVGAGVVPSISGDKIKPVNVSVITEDTIYVDDDYNESTPGWNDTHFDNIQDAIDAVFDGDTIYVYKGIYLENLKINKTISLVGEDRDSTIIDGGGNVNVVIIPLNFTVFKSSMSMIINKVIVMYMYLLSFHKFKSCHDTIVTIVLYFIIVNVTLV